jgi:hypothetical protein
VPDHTDRPQVALALLLLPPPPPLLLLLGCICHLSLTLALQHP